MDVINSLFFEQPLQIYETTPATQPFPWSYMRWLFTGRLTAPITSRNSVHNKTALAGICADYTSLRQRTVVGSVSWAGQVLCVMRWHLFFVWHHLCIPLPSSLTFDLKVFNTKVRGSGFQVMAISFEIGPVTQLTAEYDASELKHI